MPHTLRRIVLDTNAIVAAGFNPDGSAAGLVRAVREGRLVHVWHAWTRDEAEAVVRRIPPLHWDALAHLFDPGSASTLLCRGRLDVAASAFVEDPADRPFAALAAASGSLLISSDDHLLAHDGRAVLAIMPARAACMRLGVATRIDRRN